MNWFYRENGKEIGPLAERTIHELHGCGVLKNDSPVRGESSEEWSDYDQVFSDRGDQAAGQFENIIKFDCPHCQQHVSADALQIGLAAACPSCGGEIVVPGEEIAPKVKGGSPPPGNAEQKSILSQAEKLEVDDEPRQTSGSGNGAKGNAKPNNVFEKEDKEKLAGLRGALLVMPLYMFSLLFLLFALWQATGMKVNPGIAKFGFIALIVMIGISARSWQCLSWIHTDPHRATAMGKKLFLIFIILSCLDTVIGEWPSDKFEGPLSALSIEQMTYGYYDQRQLYVVDPNETQLIEAGFWAWLAFLFTFASQLVEEFAIFAFISVLYTRLRGSRPEFTWNHFRYEVTFGRWGAKYNWSESGASRI